MPPGVGNDTHQATSQSGPTAVGARGLFLPWYILRGCPWRADVGVSILREITTHRE